MAHYIFEQPNGKYGVWSTVLDAPLSYNHDSLADVARSEIDKNISEETINRFISRIELYTCEAVIYEGSVNISLYSGNMSKEDWIKFLKDIDYVGPLYEFVETWEKDESLFEDFWKGLNKE